MSIPNTFKFPERIPVAEPPAWATSCPIRRPEFKIHKTKQLALSAFTMHRPQWEIAIYHLEDGEWVLYKAYEETENCEQCGGPMYELTSWGSKRYYRYIKDGSGPAHSRPVVCSECYRISRGR